MLPKTTLGRCRQALHLQGQPIGFVLIAALLLSACSASGPPPELRFSGAQLPQSSSVGIRALQSDRPPEFNIPLSRAEAAGYGASEGFQGAALGCNATDAVGAIFCIGILPIGMVAGAIVRGAQARSEKEVVEATAALKAALGGARADVGVSKALLEHLSPAVFRDVRLLKDDEGPLSMDEIAELGLDAVIEIELSRLDLVVFGKIDPDAAIILTSKVRVKRTTNGDAGPPYSVTFLGRRHNYFALAANDAALLRRRLAVAYDELAGFIVADVFSGQGGDEKSSAHSVGQEP